MGGEMPTGNFDSEFKNLIEELQAQLKAKDEEIARLKSRLSPEIKSPPCSNGKALAEETGAAMALAEWSMQQALLAGHSFTFDWNPTTDQVQRSDSCLPILGLASEVAIRNTGQDFFQRIHPDDRDRFVQILHALTPENANYSTEFRVRRGDGAIIVLEETAMAQFDVDGRLKRVIGVATDISTRKQAEAELRRSEGRYRLLHESLRDGFVQVTMDGRIIDCNEVYSRMLGYSTEEIRLLTYIQITPERWHDMEAAIVSDQVMPRGYSDIYEKEYRRKDGTVFPVELRTILIRDDEGKPSAMWAIVRDITERKQAEETLLRERNVLQSVMNGAKNSHLVYLDRDFNFVRVNETYATTCGYQPEEMIGKNHFDLYPHAENEAIFARVRDTGEPYEVKDKPFQFPDQPERGITFWDWTLSPVTDDNGKVNGLVFSLYETTGRKRAEKALKSSERKFRRLFEKHSATMLLIDPVSLVILDANPAASKFYGYSRSRLRTMKIDSINCAPPNEFSELAKQIEEQKLDYFVTPHRLADGSVRTVEVYLSPIPIQKRRFDFVVIHDITDRKAAEDALRQNEARLQATNDKLLESEQRLQLFIEHAPAALAMFDHEMRYLSASRRWLKDYNLGDRDLTGMLHYEVFPDLPERWKEVHRRGLAGEVLREEADLYERADGSSKWNRWEIRPWYNISGEIGGIVIFTEDITERKQQEVQLKNLNNELEQKVRERTRELIETQHQFLHAEKLAAIGQLSASIAHEVNNPLQSILTVLKGLSKQANLPEVDSKY